MMSLRGSDHSHPCMSCGGTGRQHEFGCPEATTPTSRRRPRSVATRCKRCGAAYLGGRLDDAGYCVDCAKELCELSGRSPELGVKLDGEKPRWDLLLQGMPLALEQVVQVLTYGSRKYADHNWLYVERAEQRYLSAGMRHEAALQQGEQADPETGLHHLAHKLCCDLFRLELALREGEP